MKSQTTYDNRQSTMIFAVLRLDRDDDSGIHTAVNEVNAILDSHDDGEEHLLNVYTVGEQEAAMMRERNTNAWTEWTRGKKKVDLVMKL